MLFCFAFFCVGHCAVHTEYTITDGIIAVCRAGNLHVFGIKSIRLAFT